jgi:hypothetical protein
LDWLKLQYFIQRAQCNLILKEKGKLEAYIELPMVEIHMTVIVTMWKSEACLYNNETTQHFLQATQSAKVEELAELYCIFPSTWHGMTPNEKIHMGSYESLPWT